MFGTTIPIHVIDFEGAPSYGVVEYGVATLFGGQITTTHTRLCRAYAPIDIHDVAVHGITYGDSLKHEPFADDYDTFVKLRRTGPLAAHNARYEARLVKNAWPIPPFVPAWHQAKLPAADTDNPLAVVAPVPATPPAALSEFFEECSVWGPWVDSFILAKKLSPGLERYKLQAVVEALGLSNELNAVTIDRCPPERRMYHAALFDAIASALILKHLLLEAPATPINDERIFSLKNE